MYSASIVTVSDRASSGAYQDLSGPAVKKLLEENDFSVKNVIVIPDEQSTIEDTLRKLVEQDIRLIITTGGTGFSTRDVTPEATKAVIEKEAPGIAEYMRQKAMEITPRAMLSRGIAGIKDHSLILNLPGSPNGACENLSFVLPHLVHGLDILNGLKE